MNCDTHNHAKDHACCKISNSSVQQSLTEMEFERGIWYPAQNNDIDRVMFLLQKGISPDAEDAAGYTALHYAARSGHVKVCKLLLQNDANVNARTRCGRATALHRAATQGHDEIVNLLLKTGADVNITDDDGYTALHRAILSQSIPVCRLLLPKSKLDITNNIGLTPFQLALKGGNESIISLFDSNRRVQLY